MERLRSRGNGGMSTKREDRGQLWRSFSPCWYCGQKFWESVSCPLQNWGGQLHPPFFKRGESTLLINQGPGSRSPFNHGTVHPINRVSPILNGQVIKDGRPRLNWVVVEAGIPSFRKFP